MGFLEIISAVNSIDPKKIQETFDVVTAFGQQFFEMKQKTDDAAGIIAALHNNQQNLTTLVLGLDEKLSLLSKALSELSVDIKTNNNMQPIIAAAAEIDAKITHLGAALSSIEAELNAKGVL